MFFSSLLVGFGVGMGLLAAYCMLVLLRILCNFLRLYYEWTHDAFLRKGWPGFLALYRIHRRKDIAL